MTKLIYPELSYKLCGIFYEVHNKLGRTLKEKQYADAIELLLQKYRFHYKREVSIPINFGNGTIEGNKLDFTVEDKIAIDAKSKVYITREDYHQMIRYLKATKYRLGIIVNFKEEKIKPKRIVHPDSWIHEDYKKIEISTHPY